LHSGGIKINSEHAALHAPEMAAKPRSGPAQPDPATRAASVLKTDVHMLKETRTRSFGEVIRERRRQLDLTQEEVARQIHTSVPYVGHLEANKRHPSEEIIARLAEVLGLDRGELFFLANPQAKALLQQRQRAGRSAWEEFRKDERLLRAHGVTAAELEMLSQVALMGEVRSVRDFLYILNTVRAALSR
jgi:transcriptional regulator with XRE-family HTH domain